MESITVRPCSVDDIEHAPNINALLAEYADESAIPALAPHEPQWDSYRKMAELGILHVSGAFHGDELIGLVFVLCSTLPHFGKRVATTESLFVTAEARRAGVGMRLLREAERIAVAAGAMALLVSAPAGGRLEAVLQAHSAYSRSSVIFCKVVA